MQKKSRNKYINLIVVVIAAVVYYFFGAETSPKKEVNNKINQQNTQVNLAKNDNLTANDFKNYDYHISRDKYGKNISHVDYYMLVVSHSPSFCAKNPSNSLQCKDPNRFGWVIHGLWAQNASAKYISDQPRYCKGDLPMLDFDIIKPYLKSSPSPALLQGEWEKHGACGFDNASQYFATQQKLFDELNLPEKNMERNQLIKYIKENNPDFAKKYILASNYEIKLCYNLDFKAINCAK